MPEFEVVFDNDSVGDVFNLFFANIKKSLNEGHFLRNSSLIEGYFEWMFEFQVDTLTSLKKG